MVTVVVTVFVIVLAAVSQCYLLLFKLYTALISHNVKT